MLRFYVRLLSCSAALLCGQQAQAALLVYEGFDYQATPDGTADIDLNGLNGGFGWDAAWSGDSADAPNETILGSSLVSPVPHLPSTGGALRVSGSGDRFFRSVASQSFGADNTTIYMSFLARQLGTAAPNGAVELIRGGNMNLVAIGSDTNGTANFGINDKNGGIESDIVVGTPGSALSHDTDTHLWVMQIDYLPGDDSITLTYDGAVSGSGASFDAAFNEFGMFFFSGTAGLEIDEIRIGTELRDVSVVIPEPLGVSLASLAVLMCSAGCRRIR